jgi:hypothetical protein
MISVVLCAARPDGDLRTRRCIGGVCESDDDVERVVMVEPPPPPRGPRPTRPPVVPNFLPTPSPTRHPQPPPPPPQTWPRIRRCIGGNCETDDNDYDDDGWRDGNDTNDQRLEGNDAGGCALSYDVNISGTVVTFCYGQCNITYITNILRGICHNDPDENCYTSNGTIVDLNTLTCFSNITDLVSVLRMATTAQTAETITTTPQPTNTTDLISMLQTTLTRMTSTAHTAETTITTPRPSIATGLSSAWVVTLIFLGMCVSFSCISWYILLLTRATQPRHTTTEHFTSGSSFL